MSIYQLPHHVAVHVDHAERMASDILSPNKGNGDSYYVTPHYHHSWCDSWFFPRTVHHYHHVGHPSSSRSSREDKRKNEIIVGVVFAVATLALGTVFAKELGTLHHIGEDLKKLTEEREIAQMELRPHPGTRHHPKTRQALHHLTNIYNIEQSVLETYQSQSKKSLLFKGSTLAGALAASAGAFASAPAVLGGGAFLFLAGGITWAMSAAYNSTAGDIERKAESLLQEISFLKYTLKA